MVDSKRLLIQTNDPSRNSFRVNILAEDIGYNTSNKEYRIILIDRILLDLGEETATAAATIKATTLRPILGTLLNPASGSSTSLNACWQRFFDRKALKDHIDCSKYLEFISQKHTLQLEAEVRLMQSNYMIHCKFLDDAAERIKSLSGIYIGIYTKSVEQLVKEQSGRDLDISASSYGDKIEETIRIAVENYVCYLLHGKLLINLHQLYEQDDRQVQENCQRIHRSALNVSQLGAQRILSDFSLTKEISDQLRSLPLLQSPLAMVSCLAESIKLITETLNQNVKFKYLMGLEVSQGVKYGSSVTICSDDLIACLVYSLAELRLANLFSVSKYLELFGCSSITRDQAAYDVATFQLVVMYVHDYISKDRAQLPKQSIGSANLVTWT